MPHQSNAAQPSEAQNLSYFLSRTAVEVGPRILGSELTTVVRRNDSGRVSVELVSVRLTEVEGYLGAEGSRWPDPGSHSFRGRTPRNAVMFGPPAHLYTYFNYGMHWAGNLVCAPDGHASGLLLRGGEVTRGLEVARTRRVKCRKDEELAKGPGRLAQAMSMNGAAYGALVRPASELEAMLDGGNLAEGESDFTLYLQLRPALPSSEISTGPRVGLSGPGGSADYPWRFWITGERTVSRYQPAKPRQRRNELR